MAQVERGEARSIFHGATRRDGIEGRRPDAAAARVCLAIMLSARWMPHESTELVLTGLIIGTWKAIVV